MDTTYWIIEYFRVLCGYMFLMFLWPSVVFGSHLKRKCILYRFGFCTTVQITVINITISGSGFFHSISRYMVIAVFYGVFLIMLFYQGGKFCFRAAEEALQKKTDLSYCIGIWLREQIRNLIGKVKSRFPEYMILAGTLIFGMLYFSYGGFQIHSYGCKELYTQHMVIDGLLEGTVSSKGICSGALHSFAASLHILFGIPVYHILMYLQCIHVAVFLLSAYFLMREIFHWRYTPLFVLLVYLIWDVKSADLIYAMARLQWTLPIEFGLYAVFLCAVFLVKYLRGEKGSSEDLFLFMMSVAISVAIDHYVAVMSFLICIPFIVCNGKNIIKRKKQLPIMLSMVCGGLIGVLPMAAAHLSGIPFYEAVSVAGKTGKGGTYGMSCAGLLTFIREALLNAGGHMLVLLAFFIPVDAIFSAAFFCVGEERIRKVSYLFAAGIYGAAVLTGNYHGYLFCELARHEAAALVTESVLNHFPKDSYLIVAPTDERYPVLGEGWHEELTDFVENCKDTEYTVPQEYIFLYVEKRPLLYAQTHFFNGPAWLGWQKYSETYWDKYYAKNPYGDISCGTQIITGEISEEEAEKELIVPDGAGAWEIYTDLEKRIVLEAKIHDWCQRFMQIYPYEMNVYYEDDNFVCYYLVQDMNNLYRLGLK